MMIKQLLKRLLRPLNENRESMLWAATIDSTKKGQNRIVADYKHLYDIKGLTRDEYRDFRFDKCDEVFRKTFLGLNEQRFYLDYLNPIKYFSLARNKYLAHKMLEGIGVHKSQLYCYYQPEARYLDNEECANDIMGVLRILESKKVNECVIKTTESSHGENVWVIKAIDFFNNDAVMTRFDDRVLKLSSILGKEALIFESVVRQTSQFADFNKSSVNTIRFMTTLYPDGSARVISTFIKIGRAGKCVDNASDGGNVDACVDTETGMIKYAIQFDGWQHIKDIENHPDNGTQLNGVIVDNWQSICEEVKRFQQAFPYCKAAGWDIAITEDGPVVIEINDFWDRTGQFFIRRGWRNEIRDCYLSWRKYWEVNNSKSNKKIVSNERRGNDKMYIMKREGNEYKLFRRPNALRIDHLRRIASYE